MLLLGLHDNNRIAGGTFPELNELANVVIPHHFLALLPRRLLTIKTSFRLFILYCESWRSLHNHIFKRY